ncbi:hypothetical protein N2152v2_011125 [Parachlorella kessleri]
MGLPPDALNIVGCGLTQQDKLNNVATCARDIANLAMTCRRVSDLALGATPLRAYTRLEEPTRDPGGDEGFTITIRRIHRDDRYEYKHGIADKICELKPEPNSHVLDKRYAEGAPDWVPLNVYKEVVHLNCLGMSEGYAEEVFYMDTSDLGQMKPDSSDLLAAARAKHGSVEGLTAAALRWAQREAELAVERPQVLDRALKERGVELSDSMRQLEPVSHYLAVGERHGCSLDDLATYLHLLDWAAKHTPYTEVRQHVVSSPRRRYWARMHWRGDDEDDDYTWDGHLAAADKVAAELVQQEEDDCIRLALQDWADCLGGTHAALAHPSVPKEGPLRQRIATALSQQLLTSVRADYGYIEFDDVIGYSEGADELGGGADRWEMDPRLFFQGAERLFQVLLQADSLETLEVLEARVAPRLRLLGLKIQNSFEIPGMLVGDMHPLKEALRAPQEVPREEGGSRRRDSLPCFSYFYVRFKELERPLSLVDGKPYAEGCRCESLHESVLEFAIEGFQEAIDWSGFDDDTMDVQVEVLTAQQLPQWVKEAGGITA